ncbi:hypothetical protein ACLOJK_013808 [Asimina triloba]
MKPFKNLQVWVVWPVWPELGPPGPLELKLLWEEASWLTYGWASVLLVGAEAASIMWELGRTLMVRPATGTNLLLPMLAAGEGVNGLSMAGCEAASPSGPSVSATSVSCSPRRPFARTHQPPPVQPLLARPSSRLHEPDPVQPARARPRHLPRVRPSGSFRPPPVLRPFVASSYR